jgi:hypothetical protein
LFREVAPALLSFKTDHPIAAMTMPPESWTMGREIPKKLRIVAPNNSIIARKMTLLIAILRASERKTFGGASPASPRKTKADPRGLISGKSTLKAIRKECQSDKSVLPG